MGAKNAAWRWKAPRKPGCCDYCGKRVRVFKTGRSARWCSTFCASMGQHGYREGVARSQIFAEVGGRDEMEAIAALDNCPGCDHPIAKFAGAGHHGPRMCKDCWKHDLTLQSRWLDGGTARVHV